VLQKTANALVTEKELARPFMVEIVRQTGVDHMAARGGRTAPHSTKSMINVYVIEKVAPIIADF
jgi:hypothetical protein